MNKFISGIKGVTSPEFIFSVTSKIYEYIKLSLWVNLFILPWTSVNIFIEFHFGSLPIYLLSFIMSVPGLLALMKCFTYLQGHSKIFFKEYVNFYFENFVLGLKLSGAFSIMIYIVFFELSVIQLNKSLFFLFPIFIFIMAIMLISFLNILFFLSYSDDKSILRTIKISLAVSVTHPFYSICILINGILLISISYFVPIINVFIGYIFLNFSNSYLSRKSVQTIIVS